MKRLFFCLLVAVCTLGAIAQSSNDSIGVYAVKGTSITPVELINYSNMKIGRGFMSAKMKLEFKGATSPTHFKGAAKFRVYFAQPAVVDAARLYMFAPSSKIEDFGIGQFEVKKDKRFLTTANTKLFGSWDGSAKEAKDLKYEAVEIRPGVYEVTVTGKPGEYCIMHTFRGSAGYGGVVDFTIE